MSQTQTELFSDRIGVLIPAVYAAEADEHRDPTASEKAKEAGMAMAADAAESALTLARSYAREIARAGDGTCDADQVMARMANTTDPGPWCGSIFKGREWVFTGERIRSTRVENHARELKVWRLVGLD